MPIEKIPRDLVVYCNSNLFAVTLVLDAFCVLWDSVWSIQRRLRYEILEEKQSKLYL